MDAASIADFTFDAESHVFTHKGNTVPSVTQILARSGACDFSFLEEEARNYYLKRGRSVHWMLQLEDEGALNYRKVPKFLRVPESLLDVEGAQRVRAEADRAQVCLPARIRWNHRPSRVISAEPPIRL